MKTLIVDSSMRALIGHAFYPSGYTMVMYPTETEARDIGARLIANGFNADELWIAPPSAVLGQIEPTISKADERLPSAGTDAATAREFTTRAKEGQSGLLIPTHNDDAASKMMAVIAGTPYTIARRYHSLVIEDL